MKLISVRISIKLYYIDTSCLKMPNLKKEKIKINASIHEKLVRNVKIIVLNVNESDQKK